MGVPLVIGLAFLLLGAVLMVLRRVFGAEEFFGRRPLEAVDPDVAAGRVAVEETAGLEERPLMASTIVVGCDASDCAQAALGRRARACDSSLATRSLSPMRSSRRPERRRRVDRPPEALAELGQSVVGPALERARAAGVEADVELVDERPARRSSTSPEQRDARLIVVGTYGESPLRGAILGSVPHKLLQVSDRPVLVVPRAAAAQEAGHGD